MPDARTLKGLMGDRYVEGVVRELLGPLLELEKGSATGWRLVGWDAEQGVTLTLGKDGVYLLIELEARDDTRDCYARTARFNICVRRQFESGRDLTPEHHKVMAQVARVIEARERMLPDVERLQPTRRAEVREVKVDRVLVEEGAGHYYINPYSGCMIGCEFCYVADRADFSRSLEGLPQMPWGRYVDVKINAADVLRQEVKGRKPGIVRLSPILTDPYQPLERRYRITRSCLEVLLEAGFTPGILTRAGRVVDDLDLLSKFPVASVGLSIPTDDDAMRLAFEPGGDPIEARLQALEACHRAGLVTFAVIQPMLPMNVERLVERVAPFVKAVRIDRMYEMKRVLPLYEAAGCLEAAEDGFFERTGRQLREAFLARGIVIDDLDDLGGALKIAPDA